MEKRNGNIECLRVLSMMMIIILHYLMQGGLLDRVLLSETNYYIVWIIEALCYVSVNCYVLISGYFLIDASFKIKKVIFLILEVVFYSVSIYLIFCIVGLQEFQFVTLITGYLFPVIHGQYWFATVYIVLYLLFPFLNIFVKAMTKKQHIYCIIILGSVFSVIPSVFFFSGDVLGIDGGYSLCWFVFLYIISSYLRIYDFKKKKNSIYLAIYFIMLLITATVKFIQQHLFHKDLWDLYHYNSITVLIASITLFLFFLNKKEKHNLISNLCIKVGKTTFGIFLIHTHYLMREWLWKELVKPLEHLGPDLLFYLIGCTVTIFLVCSVIDGLRAMLFYPISNNRKVNLIMDRIWVRFRTCIED